MAMKTKIALCLSAIHLLLALIPSVFTGSCPSENNWIQVGKSCYRMVEEEVTWYQADERCRDFGSVLVVLNSETEQNKVWETVKREGLQHKDFWIGCQKGEGFAGEWSCIGHDGVPYDGWAAGEKNYAEGSENTTQYCARMRAQVDGRWADKPCSNRFYTICEMPPRTDIYCVTLADNGRVLSQCLTGHVIRELPIEDVIACGSACREEPQCRSFDVRDASQGANKTCQLNDKTAKELGGSSMTAEKNCYHFDL